MKYYLICIFLIITNSVFSQDNSFNDLLDYYLENCKTSDEIIYIKKTFKNRASEQLKYIPTISPINATDFKRFSSTHGYRTDPITQLKKFHKGLDIAAPLSSVIKSTAKGTVISIGISNNGYGYQVLIEHKYGFSTRYAHMYFINVKKGQLVNKNQVIGFVGSTGKSTGNHLHYEILKNNKSIDPINFLNID